MRGLRGGLEFILKLMLCMCMLGWRSDIYFGNCFRMMGVDWGLDMYLGNYFVCIVVGLWIWHLLWNVLYVCWDWAEDLAFMLDVLFYRMMGVSWGLGIQFGNYVLYVGTWTGDRRLDLGVMLDMLGLGIFFGN